MATEQEWQRYGRWNEAVMAAFFDGRWAHQPVYLDLEEEVLAEMAELAEGRDAGDPAEGLREAVGPTLSPRPDGATSMLGEHCRRTTRWKAGGRAGTPPFLAVLALFSLVAEGMRSDEVF